MNARVLVTGGSGFIGSHVVDKLLDAGASVRIFDMVPSPHHPPGSVDTYVGDLLDPRAVAAAMAGCGAVVHLAAIADVDQVLLDPPFAEAVNGRGTLNVLEAARAARVGRVIYASTIWVYDGCENAVVDETSALGLPTHLYTATKLAGEMYCASYAELFGLEHTTLRFGIPFGPRARPAAVIPQFVRRALAGQPLMIAGPGDQTRRFIYVEDLAEGVVAALQPVAARRVYNLVAHQDITVLELAQAVRELVADVDIVHTEARIGDFKGVEVSARRALTELGWSAQTTLADGLRAYVDWYLATHPDRDPLLD